MKLRRFADYALGLLVYNLAVILWGAYVRASGSGAGCGAHWPLCNGVVIPRAPQVETLVEFAHRLSSGLALVGVVLLVIWAWRIAAPGSWLRKAAAAALVLTITEALVGAGLVLFGLVADNDSTARAFSMVVHLLNTFLLLAALSLTAWWARFGVPARVRGGWVQRVLYGIGFVGLLILGASGAIAALGDTLYPASSLVEGFQQDLNPATSVLLRLRVLHPGIAAATGIYLWLVASWLRRQYAAASIRRVSLFLQTIVGVQLVLGVLNVLLLAPIWMQLVHLLSADLMWISWVILGGLVFSSDPS